MNSYCIQVTDTNLQHCKSELQRYIDKYTLKGCKISSDGIKIKKNKSCVVATVTMQE